MASLCESYVPTPTGRRVHESDAFLKMLMGPFASSKSVTMAFDMLYYAMAQNPAPPDSQGRRIRYSSWGVVRSTYQQLKTTTRNTILEVFPQGCGRITLGMPLMGLFTFPLNDGTFVQLELTMIALETPDDYVKLRSANWTGCWVNEADFIPEEIIGEIMGRVERFPNPAMGGCSWGGILMDFNRPIQGNYLYRMMDDPKDNWEVFIQPPAAFKEVSVDGRISYRLNPQAENLCNIGKRAVGDRSVDPGLQFYQNQIDFLLKQGRYDKIDNHFCMLDVQVKDGKPVFPEFSTSLHVARGSLPVQDYYPVICGMDTSGIHPAMVIMQEIQGKWCILDEIVGEEMGLEAFIEQALVPLMRQKYANCEVIISCDPANARDSFTGLAPTVHLKNYGFKVHLPKTNAPKTRILALSSLLNKQVGGLLIDPECREIIRAMGGEYRYKKAKVSGTVKVAYSAVPEKNDASHIADALQYAAMYITQGELNVNNDPELARLSDTLHRKRTALRTIAR